MRRPDFRGRIRAANKASAHGATTASDTMNIMFREFAAQWLDRVKRDCSLTYYVKGRECIALANEYIGGYKLREITPAVIQNFYDKLDAMKKKISKVYSEARISLRVGKVRLQLYEVAIRSEHTDLYACQRFRGKSRKQNLKRRPCRTDRRSV